MLLYITPSLTHCLYLCLCLSLSLLLFLSPFSDYLFPSVSLPVCMPVRLFAPLCFPISFLLSLTAFISVCVFLDRSHCYQSIIKTNTHDDDHHNNHDLHNVLFLINPHLNGWSEDVRLNKAF